MTSAKPGHVVAGRLINKQSTTALAPSTYIAGTTG